MDESRKVNLKFNMMDEMEKNAYEILQNIKKEGHMKRFVAEAVVTLYGDRKKTNEDLESVEVRLKTLENDVARICRSIGITPS